MGVMRPGSIGGALLLALGIAACSAPPVPLAGGVATLAATPLPPPAADGFVAPMIRDPSGTLCGWLDVRYSETEGVEPKSQALDLIAPVTVIGEQGAPVRGLPIVLFVHGGSWQKGEKRGSVERRAPAFGGAGVIYASMNYRLAPDWMHPAQVRDVAAALAWLHDHARAFGGDPDALFVMGHSAGAHLAALVSVDERWLGEHRRPLSMLRGAILMDGSAYDVIGRGDDRPGAAEFMKPVFGEDITTWADASPVNHVAPDKGIPPCLLLVAGRNPDSGAAAKNLADKLTAAGARADVVLFPNKTHVSITRELGAPGDVPTAWILDFVAEVSGRPRPNPPPGKAEPPPIAPEAIGANEGAKSGAP
ncbi:MAG: alpha/beta hydrolase [Planctomycetes bacterium]|nr:alpha/beta hydrolase [Planctomycetota bacterium]